MPIRDPLDDLLDRWHLPTTPTPDLHGRIHREIVAARLAAPSGWRAKVEAAFARPSFAVTFVLACVLFGLFLAEVRVSRLHAAYGTQIARNYVRLIDPLLDVSAPSSTPGKAKP